MPIQDAEAIDAKTPRFCSILSLSESVEVLPVSDTGSIDCQSSLSIE